jgi:hypothetical protein
MEDQLLNLVIQSLAQGTTKITVGHLNRYDFLRAQLPLVNVAQDNQFQQTFSGLFKLRYMEQAHRPIYFGTMEQQKNNAALNFPALLDAYHQQTGRWEVSFISKLIAIIDPNRPVWDSIVSRRLALALPVARNQANCAAAYVALNESMQGLLQRALFPNVLAGFAARFPGRLYQPMRILDTTIWGLG